MTQDLEQKVQDHLSGFVERHREFNELKQEWTEFKRKALWMLLTFLGTAIGYGIWVGSMQSDHIHLFEEQSNLIVTVKENQLRLNAVEINNSSVLARLAGIEATLQEIKLAIKQISY